MHQETSLSSAKDLPALRTSFPHQHEALKKALRKDRIALFLEMRLGKTLVAIRWAKNKLNTLKPQPCPYVLQDLSTPKPVPKVLVVCPLTVVPTWEEELDLERIRHRACLGPKRYYTALGAIHEGRWVITNYEALRTSQKDPDTGKRESYPSPLAGRVKWDIVILDESTRIKNPKSITSQIATDLLAQAPYKVILSGLPDPNGPEDYFQQMKFLLGSFMHFKNFWRWRHEYFKQDPLGYDYQPKQGTTKAIKFALHNRAIILTRKQVKIGPSKVYESRCVELPPKVMRAYRYTLSNFALPSELAKNKKKADEEKQTKWRVVVDQWLAQLCSGLVLPEYPSGHKAKELLSLLQGDLSKEQVVVWFRYNKEIKAIKDLLRKKNISVASIMGATSLKNRKTRLQKLKHGNIRVLLCQLKCAKYGLDTSASSTAIYFSNSTDYDERGQSEDRIIHPTKKEPCLYIDLVTKGTLEEDIVYLLQDKRADSKYFMSQLRKALDRRREHG